VRLELACAFTVAGQWRSFTALPEHSVAGKGGRGTTGIVDPIAERGEISVVWDVVEEVKDTVGKVLYWKQSR
jgi:hypothetical protein